jgi:hypothetical protein
VCRVVSAAHRGLREGEGEASPANDLKFVAVHELEGLVGIGGEEEHAPVRVLFRGLMDEDDVLLVVDELSDNVGGNVTILDDAHETHAQAASNYHGLPLVLARFCEGGKANVW